MRRDELIFVLSLVGVGAALFVSPHPFLIGLAVAAALFILTWLLSLALRNASIVDVLWGPGFAVVGWAYFLSAPREAALVGLLVPILVTVWAVRLALHIGIRNSGEGEDFRYAKWREESGNSFWWISLFKVFLLQALVLWVVSSPLLLAQLASSGSKLGLVQIVGLGLWLFGFLFEAIADWQLLRFRSAPENRGRVLSSGLWGLSRHPNYFGEAVLWWGIGLIVLPVGGWLALAGPALMTFTLLRVSGVAMLDAELPARKPEYAAYIASTPAFLPLGQRSTATSEVGA